MPLPLVPLVIVAAAAVAGAVTAAVHGRSAASPVSKPVAILGAKGSGKTTLIRALQSQNVEAGPIDGGGSEGIFTLNVNGQATRYAVVADVPGDPQARFGAWKDAYQQAELVLYLFRADRIEVSDGAQIDLVRNHLELLKQWSDAAGRKAPKLILVGTWADQSPAFVDGAARYAKRVRLADPIKLGRKKFKKVAPVVVGSLEHEQVGQLLQNLEQAVAGSRKASEER